MELDILSRLAFKYGSDKCPQLKHSFTPYYYQLLKDKRKSVKKVLEIGVGAREMERRPYCTGASLFMWRDFFPNAKIYGADIDTRAMVTDFRIKTFICDQTNEKSLIDLINLVGPDIDLLIDDGSHKKDHQIYTCQTLMPIISKEVIYIIEDVQFTETVSRALSQYDCQITGFQGKYKVKDDKLIVVKREQ